MKAVFQNSLFSVVCLACVFWAAPTQTAFHSRTIIYEPPIVLAQPVQPVLTQSVKPGSDVQKRPSIEDGSILIACW